MSDTQQQRNEHLATALFEIGEKNKRAGAFVDNTSSTAAMLDANYATFDRENGFDVPGRAAMARNYEKHDRLFQDNFIMACGYCAVGDLCPYRYDAKYFEEKNHYYHQRKQFLRKLEKDPATVCFPIPKYR